MPEYDRTSFDPPAPLALVELRSPHTSAALGEVPLLLDTGADVTMLPRVATERLGITPVPARHYEIPGFDGSVTITAAVDLDVRLLHRTFRGRYLLVDSPLGILGRDILRHLVIVLDGPESRWDEAPRA